MGGIGARPEQEDRRSNRARLHRAQRNGSAHARVRPVNRKIGWAESTAAGFMAVATVNAGGGNASDGMLTEGPIYMANAPGGTVGQPVYLSTEAGRLTSTQPGSGKIVRVMGYLLSTNVVYFNPSPDWIKKV